MDALDRARHVRAFRATDAFALEAYRITRTLNAAVDPGLVQAIRRSAVHSIECTLILKNKKVRTGVTKSRQ